MIAVHFGAGNIGRGFIGCLLEEAGYEVIFLDVNESLIQDLRAAKSYRVLEIGEGAKTHTIKNFWAIDSRKHEDEAIYAISMADIITTSVGANLLKFVAPLIHKGLEARTSSEPALIMACENAINATDLLKAEIELEGAEYLNRANFANTAVDRIVPIQVHDHNLDVIVESFCEWVIDTSGIVGEIPKIPGATFVSNLEPYIERKLYTVNTGHSTLAYHGQTHGALTMVEATSNPTVMEILEGVLNETSQVLIRRHGLDAVDHAKYVEKTVNRFRNPELNDTVLRVGREPSRKVSRNERLVGPAAMAAEYGLSRDYLITTIAAALQFEDATDPAVKELHSKLQDLPAEKFVKDVMGIEPSHPLSKELTECVKNI